MRYLIVPTTLAITAFTKANVANENHAAIDGSVLVGDAKDLATVDMALLVSVYNRAAREGQGREITKFADRETAMRRTWPCIEFLARPSISNRDDAASTTTPQDEENTTMATTKTSTKRTATKSTAKKATAKKAAPAAESGARGRTSKYAGLAITKLVDENPRREGTNGYNSFALIRNGMTYEQYVEKGGRPVDLQWDIDHKYVKVGRA